MPTRREVFDPLVSIAKERVAELAETNSLSADDAGFFMRALFDLEADGVGLFDGDREADTVFFADVAKYLAARVGAEAADALALENAVMQFVIQSEVKR